MNRYQRIISLLTKELEPTRLELVDESARHTGHAGSRPEGETHFALRIASPRFKGLSRIQCHRLVHAPLKDEMENGLHSLSISISDQ